MNAKFVRYIVAIFAIFAIGLGVAAQDEYPPNVVGFCEDNPSGNVTSPQGESIPCSRVLGEQTNFTEWGTATAEPQLVAPQAVRTEEGEVIIPPVTGEVTQPFVFVMNDTPVYSDSGMTQLAGTAVKHQSFPVASNVQAPAGLIAIRIANTDKVYFITANMVQVAERDYIGDFTVQTNEIFELGLINGCPDLEEARNIVAIRTANGDSGRFALERISTEFCSYRFSGASEVTATMPLGAAVQFLNFAGIGTGDREETFAGTFRFLVGLPAEDVVNSNICAFVQAAVTDALNRPASERFEVQPYGVTCPNLDRSVPEQITAQAAVVDNSITFAPEGTTNAGCPILPLGSAQDATATVAFKLVQATDHTFCLFEYDESAGIGNITFVVPDGVIVNADDGRYCSGQLVVTGGASWYWDSSECTSTHGG